MTNDTFENVTPSLGEKIWPIASLQVESINDSIASLAVDSGTRSLDYINFNVWNHFFPTISWSIPKKMNQLGPQELFSDTGMIRISFVS
jgi:hypothetical protein